MKGLVVAKQHIIETYLNTISGATVKVSALCTATGTTYPTMQKFIANNPHRFELVSRGTYRIRAASIIQNISSSNTVDSIIATNTSTASSFDW